MTALDAKVSLPVLIQLACPADCLRVAHLALDADGRVAIDELARVGELVGVAAAALLDAGAGERLCFRNGACTA